MLDVYDERMNWTGVISRKDVHALGLWHRTFQCWIVSRAGGELSFVYECDQPLEAYRLQPDEVTGLLLVTLEDVRQLILGSIQQMTAKGLIVDEAGEVKRVELEVTTEDLVPHPADYYPEFPENYNKELGKPHR